MITFCFYRLDSTRRTLGSGDASLLAALRGRQDALKASELSRGSSCGPELGFFPQTKAWSFRKGKTGPSKFQVENGLPESSGVNPLVLGKFEGSGASKQAVRPPA